LGDGNPTLIRWDDLEQIAPTFTLKDLKEVAGGCNFLKCDCEGAEWLINPDHLEGVRRIEMELHLPPIGPEVNPALLEYIADNYTFTLDRIPSHGPLGLLGHLHAFRKA
jgi:hypothetical protein